MLLDGDHSSYQSVDHLSSRFEFVIAKIGNEVADWSLDHYFGPAHS